MATAVDMDARDAGDVGDCRGDSTDGRRALSLLRRSARPGGPLAFHDPLRPRRETRRDPRAGEDERGFGTQTGRRPTGGESVVCELAIRTSEAASKGTPHPKGRDPSASTAPTVASRPAPPHPRKT